jgi:hypothetical protein
LDEKERIVFKESLGYAKKDKIILHTGTVSLWYDFESEVKLVKEMMKQDSDIHFLVLNKKEHTFIQQIFKRYQLPTERVKISSSSFDKVYKYLNIADASLFFIRPSYSKQASAPTKFAENVACHLPSITNDNVGDMGYYLKQYDVGILVDLKRFDMEFETVATKILEQIFSKNFDNEVFDVLFAKHFDKKMAVKKYQYVYNLLTKAII